MRIPVDQSASGTILLVHGQALHRELIHDTLVSNGFKVLVAPDGDAALLQNMGESLGGEEMPPRAAGGE